jgi:hypothetical protein
MFTLWGAKQKGFCDGNTRRGFLRAGALGCAGLSLADLLCLGAKVAPAAEPTVRGKSVIMVCLPGGPSHIDSYDMKPDAPGEYRGEFQPIQTNMPGIRICELLPLQAKIADKITIIRNLRMGFNEHVNQSEVINGFAGKGSASADDLAIANRPAFGSVVSRLRAGARPELPPYVSLSHSDVAKYEKPAYLGASHRPFRPTGPELANLGLARGMTVDRLTDRKELLRSFDRIRRDIDAKGDLAGMDAFAAQALEMIASPKARDAFDISREPQSVHEKYGQGLPKTADPDDMFPYAPFLQARRLVEAGIPVVTLSAGGWDHHGKIFPRLRSLLPRLDRALFALITDLHERGLAQDVSVVVWGEFGRTPVIDSIPGSMPGRNHWPDANFALVAGGGLRMGQVVGETDNRGGRPKGIPYTPQNLLATLYGLLGVDPSQTLPDHQGRPLQLLDDCKPIAELA